ncbi:MAG: hypothetical protein MI892_13885 [Desulfobacterales bacterium]|nr:hypothetical protein [Desulfobacterales bacterium]
MERLKKIDERMAELEGLIRETRDRLPAHSVKPPVMIELLELEDEYDELMKERAKLKAKKDQTS